MREVEYKVKRKVGAARRKAGNGSCPGEDSALQVTGTRAGPVDQ